jgi:hypothetical protein
MTFRVFDSFILSRIFDDMNLSPFKAYVLAIRIRADIR